MGKDIPMEVFEEGGFVNDRRGKATQKLRESMKGKVVANPPSAYEQSRRGNNILKKFK